MSRLTGLGGRLYSGETSIDVIGKKRRWYAFSGLLIIISLAALSIQGLKLGIEFKGGASYTVTKTGINLSGAEDAIKTAAIPGEPIVQTVGTNRVRIQTGALTGAQSSALQDALSKSYGVSIDSIDTQIIGPSWGKEITRKALYGLIGFIVVVLLYLAMAFEPKMAVSAIIAVIHDVFITVGIYALVGFDVTPATVIGFLTILGYSLYDTVVVFDKIRENTLGQTRDASKTFGQQVNLAINQTLSRTVLTALTVFFTTAVLYLFGGKVLEDMAFVLCIGVVTGTYSTIYIAGFDQTSLAAKIVGIVQFAFAVVFVVFLLRGGSGGA